MKKFFNVILVILLIIIEFSTILLVVSKHTITKENINKIFNSTTESFLNDDNVKNNIIDTLSKETSIDKTFIKNTLESKTAKKVLSEITNSVIEYNLGNKEKLSKDEINNLIDNNIDDVIEETNYNISDSEKEKLVNDIKKNSDKILERLYGDNNE